MLKLEEFLNRKGVWYKIIDKSSTIHTSDASQVTGIALERITKSLVFLMNNMAVLAIIQGNRRVDEAKLARTLKTDNISLVPFKESEKYSGYPPGGTPPVHHYRIGKTVVDRNLLNYRTIFGGGGTREKMIEMRIDDVIDLTNAIIADISVSI